MKVVFMGTPDFAAVSLERLYKDGHEVLCVLTQPDKPKNRGMKMAISPVKNLASLHGTTVYQPESLRSTEIVEILRSLEPELITVVAYGKLLPLSILELPSNGCINIHGSLLPKYRGSAPIQHTVLNGDPIAGVSSIFMGPEMDAGDIILEKSLPVGPDETSGELFARLSLIGADLLSETISAIAAGTVQPKKQNADCVTCAPPLTKELCPIDWTQPVQTIHNKIRGLNPWPVATAEICGTMFKIYKADGKFSDSGKAPGTVIAADCNGIEIACGNGTVTIKELQAAGGKRMSAADYLRGHPICH